MEAGCGVDNGLSRVGLVWKMCWDYIGKGDLQCVDIILQIIGYSQARNCLPCG